LEGQFWNSASWTNFGGLGALGLGDTAAFGKVKSHTVSEKTRFEGEFPQLNLPKLLDLSHLNYDTEQQPASHPHWVCSNTGFVFETTTNL
jgi:hypothetical protein